MTARPQYDPTNTGNKPGDGPLRAGGQPAPTSPTPDMDRPDKPCKAAEAQLPDLQMMRDLWEGNTTLHRQGTLYLPQAPGEAVQNYNVRLQRAVLFNATRNTIVGLTGYVFREDPELGDDVPVVISGAESDDEAGTAAVEGHWENIDLAGTHGSVWLRDRFADAMTAGHAAIFVEYPATEGKQTAGQEQRGEVRPYWLPILKENILSWRSMIEHGRLVLTQLVLRECTMVPHGLFGERKQERYRVLYREGGVVGWRLLEVHSNVVVEVGQGLYPTQDEIPVAEIPTAGKRALFESDPPFLDLGYLNLAHYRQWSDYDTSIHKTCVPIYWEAGVDQDALPQAGQQATPLVLGPNAVRRSTNPAFKIGYASHDGAALGMCKAALDDLKQGMAELGLAALASSKRVAETATAKEMDKSATDSVLAVNARGLQDAVERALYFHARYLRLPGGGSIEINRDYEGEGMDPAKMTAWATLAEKLGVPPRFVLDRLLDAGEIPEGTDLDALELEMMAQSAAKEAQAAAAQEAQAAAMLSRRQPAPGTVPPAGA